MTTTVRMRRLLGALTVLTLMLTVGIADLAWADGDEIRLIARLAAPLSVGDASGKAEYRQRADGRRRFSVEVQGLTPGALFDVMVAGEVVGTIVSDVNGGGEIDFDTNFEPGDDPATQFPANFPALDGGELVQVGPLTGNLQPKQ